jgi:hypothetical protein
MGDLRCHRVVLRAASGVMRIQEVEKENDKLFLPLE